MRKIVFLSLVFIGLLSCNQNKKIPYHEDGIFCVFENKNYAVIKSEMLPNANRYTILFYNDNGIEVNRQEVYGEYKFYWLDAVDKLIACQYAVLVRANESYSFDCNGNLLFTFIHDYENKQTEITNDNNYIIFVSNKVRRLKEGEEPLYPSFGYTAYNHLIIYNLNNGLLEKEIDFDGITDAEIEINDKKYYIELMPADIPG
jgi:uncharacterized protein YcfL